MPADTLFDNFASPPKAFSPVPIWWWSGERIERSRLRWQLERFAEGGVYNLIVLNLAPTSPLYGSDPDDPPFLSEAWWELFLGMCEDARELGVSIWFYDQIGFSGANFQGQVVRENSRFAGQWLDSVVYEGNEPAELICPAEGTPLAAAVTRLDDDGEPVGALQPLAIDNGRVTVAGGQRQRVRLVYAVRRGFDYFSVEGCARLLDMVHGEFERRAAHLFGDVIVGSFQDELPSLASWGEGFADAFRAQKGYDLIPRLVELWDGRGDEADRLRCDFHQVRATLAEEAFFKPLFNWHERHHLLCGFDQQGPARAGHPIATVGYYADYLRTHRWFTAPGSDHHGEAKIHSSLAHLYERPRVWIESFHSSGWGGTLEETFDWLLPWLRAGATLYDPHAVYYSTRGGWWEWAPPSTCWRQPYWRHYAHFANAVSRLCYVLSQGHHVCDIGVLFPTTTVQAGLLADPKGIVLADAQAAHDAYEKLVGSMFWQNMRPGVLDRDRRDYDVLDDASLQRGAIEDGALVIGAERYRALVVLGGSVLEAATAAKLAEFVEGGGRLIAVGALPRLAVGANGDAISRLQQMFADGRARHLDDVEALPDALADLPRIVDAPVPTLHRRIDGRDVVFAPAAAPYATRQAPNRSWLDVAYTFDPGDYQRGMRVTMRGVHGAPELWDAFTGTRRTLPPVEESADGVVVEIPFDTGPAALLVWPARTGDVAAQPEISRAATLVLELDGEWTVTLEPTIDNRYGDLARPAHPGALPVQTWRFQHRMEATGQDGVAAGWHSGVWSDAQVVTATFGPQGWWIGPLAAETAPAPLPPSSDGSVALPAEGWQPVVYSASRGVMRDPIHLPTLGPKGHVPEEFLVFGRVLAGQAVQVRTGVWMEEAADLTFALGAPAAKQLWINGAAVTGATSGYLWLAPVRLRAGFNSIEFRLTAEQNLNLRAAWALVRAPARYARPEWMTTADEPVLHSQLSFSCDIDIPFTPAYATLQVGADAPCRVLVNGVEIGRQGGFDPYHSPARVQPYPVSNFRQGRNRIELEMQDGGRKAAMLADGIAVSVDGHRFTWSSGPGWQVSRDHAPATPVQLRRRQWADMMYDFVNAIFVDMDPAFSHLWRRPHPLPQAAWLEDEPADDTVVAVETDPFGGVTRVEWLRWRIPPGVQEMSIPVAGRARLWIDGVEQPIDAQGVVRLGEEPTATRVAVLRVETARGDSGGRLLRGPVSYRTGEGRMRFGLWAEQGLESYAGGVRYRTHVALDVLPEGKVWLDLGRVRGTAEAWVNGRSVGVRVLSPYRFDVTAALMAGENQIEVLVLNTLAPYLDVQSPTFYVFPGQCDSGPAGTAVLVQA
ncbi:MAG TPA: hypothetical protein GX400_10955 [Chloroflexi bacterium]|nr:hypothetical protein [Chloroflexota bacterium]